MEIKKCNRINAHPVLPVALRGWLELIERGYCTHNRILLGWDYKAIYAEEGGNVVGVLVYQECPIWDQLAVCLGYVLPDYRRRGVYRQMWEALVKEAQALKFTNISGSTNVRNVEMQGTMNALGRHLDYLDYDFNVPPLEQ